MRSQLKYAILICLIICLLALSAIVKAKDIKTEWSYSAQEEALIVGYKIYDNNNVVVVDNIPPESRTATILNVEECGSWYIRAISPVEKSEPSHIINWCPDAVIPVVPGTFLITITPVD